jgi:filamentous hemagglutinin family protein
VVTRLEFRSSKRWKALALITAGVVRLAPGATLPTPCVTGGCGVNGPATWVTSGAATAVASSQQLTVQQTTGQAILNWSNFNISADGKVVYQQPSSTAIALNRIFQGSPSTILGSIQANGQIYLVNPNGVVFGSTATVNAAGILVSTLGISDATFQAGLVSPQVVQSEQPALASDGRSGVLDNNGNPVLGTDGQPIPIQLTVQPGATLSTTGSGGRILLASQAVTNGGTLSAPGGQVIVAAGSEVFLSASTDPSLRGLLVEVDQGGTAWNTLTGQISTPDGNITMVGLAVNQDGRLSASTSVSENGSVRLLAQDTIQFNGNNPPSATHSGTATLGASSSIEVLPDLNDPTTAVVDQVQMPSSVTITGEQVYFEGGSRLIAPNGQLSVTATANPTDNLALDPASRIRIDSGAVIDLSGSAATLPMSANLLSVQLNATELADDPQQRTGILHGQYVVIDTRADSGLGTTLANVSADIAAIPQNIAQRTETGGSATFQSAGDLVAAAGATINVSGGYTQFQGGNVATTQLIQANGKIVDIGAADPSQTYTGIINAGYTVVSNTWGVVQTIPNTYLGHYEAGYVEGAAAGTLAFSAPSMVLAATLIGRTDAGPYQRTPSTQPAGGQLILGLASPLPTASGFVDDYRLSSVTFDATVPQIAVSDTEPLPAGLTLQLPTNYLSNGFTSTTIYSNGSVQVPYGTPISMLPGSTFSLYGNDIEINSNISSAGGKLLFESILTAGVNGAPGPLPGITFGDGIALDVRGNWTNDLLVPYVGVPYGEQPATPVAVNGGSISAILDYFPPGATIGPELRVGSNDRFELSGGAWLQSTGAAVYGQGGQLTLQSDGQGGRFVIGSNVGLDAFGVDGESGGAISLEADQIVVTSLPANLGWENGMTQSSMPLVIGSSLFSDYGFSSVKLVANGAPSPGAIDILSLAPGTAVTAVSSSLILSAGYESRPSAADVFGLSQVQLMPEADRTPMTVSLIADPSTYSGVLQASGLLIPAGSSLSGDPGAIFNLSSTGPLNIGGVISAPGGAINLAVLSPPGGQDPGFLPNLALTLESGSVLNVAGVTVLQPKNPDVLQGSVLAGGSVTLIARRGSVDVLAGANVDIAGTQGLLDLSGGSGGASTRTEVASSGGSLVIQAPDSISWLGNLEAAGGHGAGPQPSGGALTIDLDPTTDGSAHFPTGVRSVEVVAAARPALVSSPSETQALIGGALLTESGIDQLTLKSSNGVIEIDPGVSLSMGRELDLYAPVVQVTGSAGNANLAAPYVLLSNEETNLTVPRIGTATLDLDVGALDVVGSVVFNGLKNLVITSSGDVRLTSIDLTQTQVGALATAGNLTIDAERIYPTSNSTFVISSTGPQSVLTLGQTGASPGAPFSVGGSVSFTAPIIEDSGTVLAPFGTIAMTAGQSLTLAAGSETSVSGNNNLFLYGQIVDGTWYETINGATLPVTSAPPRQVTLQAPAVTIAQGATVDVSGGGDLYTYEWTPGTGGTQDVLSMSVSPNLYAIVPSLVGQLTPYDPNFSSSSAPAAGTSVYLSGVPGLAAGDYPLLPARYSLLPGAFLVSAVPGLKNMPLGSVVSEPNGATVVSGYYVSPGTQLTSGQTLGFAVQPGSYAFQLADYTTFTGTSVLTAAASTAGAPLAVTSLPASAGTLELAVSESLSAAGSVVGSAGSGGEGALIEVSAPALVITGSAPTPANAGVEVSSTVLQGWNPARLVLGGVLSTNGSTLSSTANTVTIGGGVALNLSDITVIANSNITVQSGAQLSSSGTNSTLSTTPSTVTLSGTLQPAFLEVSTLLYETPIRGAAAGGASGTVYLDAGSSLTSNGSVVIDAPGGGTLAATLSGTGTRWSLGSDELDFAGAPGNGNALTVTPALQSVFEQGTALRLAADTIAFDTPVTLGTAASGLQLLTVDTSDIRNLAGNGSSSLAASSILLENSYAAVPSPKAPASGSLQLVANSITTGPGSVTLDGFSAVNMSTSGDFTLNGAGGVSVGNDLTLTATRVLATSGANATLQAAGTLSVLASGGAQTNPSAAPVGGALALEANVVDISGTIMLPSGSINVAAGSALNIASGALLSAAGESVTAAGRTLGSPGGTLTLSSGGSLTAAADAQLSVAGAGSNNAGSIVVGAVGAAQLDAVLSGQAAGGATGGSFQLTAGSLNSFQSLNGRLESGGFTAQRDVDLGSGDLSLAVGQTLTASSVELVAETGSVQVGGTITAPSAALPSSIQLYGASGVTVLPTGSLLADAVGGAPRGGSITLGTSAGVIDLQPGSLVSARGATQSGSLIIRAPATTSDVAIAEMGATSSGLAEVIVEPVETFAVSGNPTAADFAAIYAQTAQYATVAGPQIAARLSSASGAPLIVQPGVELDSVGDLNLGSLDLTTWRFNGEPGVLTIRAGGSVTLNGIVSDGFTTDFSDNGPILAPLPGASSTIQIVAGARFGSPNPLATTAGAAADLTLGAGSVLSTGTGAIDLAAARDLVFQPGASVYTGGVPSIAPITLPAVGTANFLSLGGDINLSAGRDVVGAFVVSSPGDWQQRGLSDANPNPDGGAFWGPDPTLFNWNVGTLGGGALVVSAGRNILNLSAAAADSAIVNNGVLTEYGGGPLSVSAAGDIDTSYFYFSEGTGLIRAGGSIGSNMQTSAGNEPLGTMLIVGSAQVTVGARGNVLLESAINPTIVGQPDAYETVNFFTFGDSSALDVQSSGGTVEIAANGNDTQDFLGHEVVLATNALVPNIFPSSLEVRSFSGDISLNAATIYLFPSATGQLDLFAAGNIEGGILVQSDATLGSVTTPLNASSESGLSAGLILPAQGAIHINDPAPAAVTAGLDLENSNLSLAKPVSISVGQDMINTSVVAQNLQPDEVTEIEVGRNLIYNSQSVNGDITVGGPGALDVLAGGQVNLGFSEGISTTGRILDPQIASTTGADITVVAGLGAQGLNINGFMSAIVSPSSAYSAELISLVSPVATSATPTFSQALTLFDELSLPSQVEFVDTVFFNELVQAGRLANTDPTSDFARGYAAIDALFPGSRTMSAPDPYSGDLTLDFSRIYSLSGGNISLLVPGGAVNVGLAVPPVGVNVNRTPSQLGIVAQESGNVSIFSSGDVLVNSSRIFTLGGGNIAVWSTTGNIDAGRGAKASVSAPPPVVEVDVAGNITLDFAGAVAGSGIRTIITTPNEPAGNVDLIAPVGFVNAGDAGIGSAGNLNIAARFVLGTQNISVGGVATGVPPEVSGIGASLSGATTAASSTTNASTAVANSEQSTAANAPISESAMSWLDVFVLGVGEETCPVNDLECMKREREKGRPTP